MAKSLRSKWRRKCRAVKRERYGVKELARLKKTLGMDENAPTDADMKDLSEIATGELDYFAYRRFYLIQFFCNINHRCLLQ